MKTKRACHYRVYQDGIREWRWEFISANRKTLAVSSESYQRKSKCLAAVELLKSSRDAPVIVE